MRLRAFSSIGGLKLFANPRHPSQPGFRPAEDFLQLSVDREDLSSLAIAMVREINMDASEELIKLCQEVCVANSPTE